MHRGFEKMCIVWCTCNFNLCRCVDIIYFYFFIIFTKNFFLRNTQIYPTKIFWVKQIHCMRFHDVHPPYLAYRAMFCIGDSYMALQFYHCSEPHSLSPKDLCENIFEPHTHQQICGVVQTVTFLFCTICREICSPKWFYLPEFIYSWILINTWHTLAF